MEKMETVYALCALFNAVDNAELKCRKVLRAQPEQERDAEAWQFLNDLRDLIFSTPGPISILRRLEAEAEAEREAA